MLDKLDILRKKKGLSQAEIESAARLSRNRISKWRDGQGEATAAQALRLARLFGVSVESLIDDNMEITPDQEVPRLRVVEIAQRIGWEEVWLRLIGAATPGDPMKPGTIVAGVPRRDKATGG